MTRPSRSRSYASTTAFLDLLFLTILTIAAILAMAVLLINPPTSGGDVESKAEYLVVLEWGSDVDADLDLWVMAPDGSFCSFTSRNTGLMSLDVDDLGARTETIVLPDGTETVVPVNREVVSIKAVYPGEYVVNVHLWSRREASLPIRATVTLIKVNPFSVVTVEAVDLPSPGAEETAFRFVVKRDGSVSDLSDLPASIATGWRSMSTSGTMGYYP